MDHELKFIEERYAKIEADLEKEHTPEHLWDAPPEELFAAIEEQQGEIFTRSLIIAFCMRRLREMATARAVQ